MTTSEATGQKKRSVRQPVLLGLFTGTAVGAGYLLAGVPNVELMTLIIAACGSALGLRSGLMAGMLAAMIYSLGSPFGLPVPLMLVAQACGLAAAGVLGGVLGNRVLAARLKGRRLTAVGWAVVIGAGSTLIYDILTNLAIVGAWQLDPRVVLVGAVPYALLHLASNVVVFGALLPVLTPRLAGLKRSALVGRVGPAALLIGLFAAWPAIGQAQDVAPTDSTAIRAAADSSQTAAAAKTTGGPKAKGDVRRGHPVVPAVEIVNGWERPLWNPFAQDILQWLRWHSNRVPVVDGGLGAPALVLGEAQTARQPLVLRDGIPIGTGHVLADDLWLVPTTGLVVGQLDHGADGWGGTGGVIALQTADPDPGKAVSAYRGVKGRHETYFRSINLLTPRAAWRAAFEFEESLDKEGYNFTSLAPEDFAAGSENEFPGHSRIRQSRARLFRELSPHQQLSIEFTNGRLTKDSLPVYGAEHLELWDDGLAAVMKTGNGSWVTEAKLFWRNRDVIWGDRASDAVVGEGLRKLETGREGLSLAIDRVGPGHANPVGLNVHFTNWYLTDSLTDEPWLEGLGQRITGQGQTAQADLHTRQTLGATMWQLALGADWQDGIGAGPSARFGGSGRGDSPWWQLAATYGGRMPRSDELLTPLLHDVAGRRLELLPNPHLQREKTARGEAKLQFSLLGLDLAVDGSITRLREGITWAALTGQTDRGRWENGLDMNSRRLTGTIARQGRFLGWGRVQLEGTWQKFDEIAGRATFLPPERYLRSRIMWENHFFAEDGILQLALFSTRQAAMADPWDVTRTAQLPERTVHDLLVGFRLVGANISLLYRNLTGERSPMTSSALSEGQGLDMRLHWAWVY